MNNDESNNGPLISIAWKNISVTAVPTLITGQTEDEVADFQVYPNWEEKLPYAKSARKLIPNSMHPTKSTQASSGLPLRSCHICGRSFHKMTYLKRHIQSHSSVKPFKCKICGWGFFQYSNLKRHMISHNSNTGEGFNCHHCRATFTTKSVLSVHLRDAHNDTLHTNKRK